MTDRERWTVYPLLFLTLGISVKDKLAGLVKVDTVSCTKLIVTDRSGHDRIVATTSPTGGIVQIEGNNQNTKLVLGYINNLVGMLFADAQGSASVPPSIAISENGEKSIGRPQKPAGGGRKTRVDVQQE